MTLSPRFLCNLNVLWLLSAYRVSWRMLLPSIQSWWMLKPGEITVIIHCERENSYGPITIA